jgi:D-erythrose 4-phosphate dehydrogenase|tara:strand:+ start:31768 stop:32787 length:1020 start_codon:yes stop_codon:yes gene_type:complete
VTRLGINGFGRIGRCVFRALAERNDPDLSIVAINELAPPESVAYLTRYDSTHGRFDGEVSVSDGLLQVNGESIRLTHSANIDSLAWGDVGVDILIESTGSFSDRATAQKHLDVGAKSVIFSQPAEFDVDATVVYGVNHIGLNDQHKIISAASCTTNCVVPPLQALDQAYGIESVMIRTLHAAMNDQPVIDAYHQSDMRRNRAAFESIIPVETELAKGIGRILPHLESKIQASALRMPISDVSAMDIGVVLARDTDIDSVKALIKNVSETEFSGVLTYTNEPLVSCDFVHDSSSGVVDLQQLRMSGARHLKLLVWFDNEWGYANRILDIAGHWAKQMGKD